MKIGKTRPTDLSVLMSVSMLAALATVLMFFSISVPLVPSFLKIDISELPAIIAAFTIGPWAGVMVCLVKNAVNLFFTYSGGIGELINFLLGCAFVIPAGFLYQKLKTRPGALLGGAVGAVSMMLISLPLNYFVVYPVYAQLMPMEVIMGMYQTIRPSTDSLLEALVVFNMPFTFVKAAIDVAIALAIYKPLLPVINGSLFMNRKPKTRV